MAQANANASGVKAPTTEGSPSVKADPGTSQQPNLISLTFNADTGEVVKIEKVEAAGARRELRDDDAIAVTGTATTTLDTLIERAFEAGIACLLEPEAEGDEADEPEDPSDLRHALLIDLMEKSSAKDLLKRDVLGKAILASAIAQMAAARAASAEKGKAQQQDEGGARKPH
jgi:hypothetical protein